MHLPGGKESKESKAQSKSAAHSEQAAIASDGAFLYAFTASGLAKIGTGYQQTVPGKGARARARKADAVRLIFASRV